MSTAGPLLAPEFLRKLERLAIASRKVFAGRTRGERRSKRRGESVEFADYRDYSPGDDLRFVDWNIYGRLDRLFLKLFMEEEDLLIYLLLDVSESMSFGEPEKLGYAKQLAAALGYIGLVNMERVSVAAFSSRLSHSFGPARGRHEVWHMFSFLESLEPGGETELAPVCREFGLRHRRRGVAIVMSDFFDPAGYEQALKFFVRARFETFVLHVLSPEDIVPSLGGHLRLYDAETNEYTEITANDALLDMYRGNARRFIANVRAFCVRNGMGYFLAQTDTPFDRLILESLRKGGLLK